MDQLVEVQALTEYHIWIENPLTIQVNYKVNGTSATIQPGQATTWTRRGDSVFDVEFDSSFNPGYQRRAYRLLPGNRNY